MKYEVVFREQVIDQLVEWEPPQSALDDLERFVDEQLAVNPLGCLQRISGTGAMQCSCPSIERPANRVHVFLLRVHYGEDEKTLFVYDAFYYIFG